jgi:hypothetical protein
MSLPCSHLLALSTTHNLHIPSLLFLVEHTATKGKLLFDLGLRKDLTVLPPTVHFSDSGWDLRVDKDVSDILRDRGRCS